tara:strand:+ start:218 stop:406 length:189 start_codon:yes stop_codon:yes gene_type:complete
MIGVNNTLSVRTDTFHTISKVYLGCNMYGKPDYMEETKQILAELAAAITHEVIDVLRREGIL